MRSIFWLMPAMLVESVALRDRVAVEPTITQAPRLWELDLRRRQNEEIDPVSLADVLLTAFPESLREMAATNLPAVSKELWSEFLDGKKPGWFTALPNDIQNYLVAQYGPQTASASVTDSSGSAASSGGSSSDASSGSITTSSDSSTPTPTSTRFVTSLVTVSVGSIGIPIAAPTSSQTAMTAPDQKGLSTGAKVGLGIGVSAAVLAVGALFFGCCLLHRRRKRKQQHEQQYDRPPTPAFITSSYQGRGLTDHDEMEQHQPLHDAGGLLTSDRDLRHGYRGLPHSNSNSSGSISSISDGTGPYSNNGTNDVSPAHELPSPVVGAYHSTHSGRNVKPKAHRASSTSLHSVPEVPEYSDHGSPVVPPPRSPKRRSLVDSQVPTIPAASAAGFKVKRKGVGSGNSANGGIQNPFNPQAYMGRYEKVDAVPTAHEIDLSNHRNNPFNDYSYVEDYGPEYHDRGYGDIANGGGYSEWPLRNEIAPAREKMGKSPSWDRVYEGT